MENPNSKTKEAILILEVISVRKAFRIISSILTFALILSVLCVPVFAADPVRLHQYTGEPIDYKDGNYEGLQYSFSTKDITANIIGYDLSSNEDAIFWHFVNPDKLGGTANITFVNTDGDEVTFTNVKPYKADQHWGVITPFGWKLLDALYYPATEKAGTLFNLSHTAGGNHPTVPFGEISFSVYKELGEYAAAYFNANPNIDLPEFTFELSLKVDGVPYAGGVDISAKTIKAGESAFWGPFDFTKTVTVEYAITEKATNGYVQVGTAVVQATKNGQIVTDTGIIEIASDDIVEIDYEFTNEFVFGKGETAAAFSAEDANTNTFGVNNKSWHFVSFKGSDEFVVLAGQNYQIGTGKIVNGVPVITWAPGVKVFVDDMAYAFAPASDKIKLADTAPGQLAAKGKNGFGTRVYSEGCYAKIHVNVEIPELLYPVLDIRN